MLPSDLQYLEDFWTVQENALGASWRKRSEEYAQTLGAFSAFLQKFWVASVSKMSNTFKNPQSNKKTEDKGGKRTKKMYFQNT